MVVGMFVTHAYFAPSLERLVEIAESFCGIGAPKGSLPGGR
jgi:hypothetical protein